MSQLVIKNFEINKIEIKNMKGKWILDRKEKYIKYLSKTGDCYELKVGNLNVEMIYSKNNKKIDECILNVLKRKNDK